MGYQNSYVVTRNLPYEVTELLPSGEYVGGGVLGKGQLVWMQHETQTAAFCQAVSVYAEDIGIIHLNPRYLSRLDS